MVWGMGERERSGLKSAQPSAARFFLRTPPPVPSRLFVGCGEHLIRGDSPDPDLWYLRW